MYKAIKLALCDINRNRRLRLSPRNPCAGVATGLLKTQLETGKNDTALIPLLNTFKITTFPHLEPGPQPAWDTRGWWRVFWLGPNFSNDVQ